MDRRQFQQLAELRLEDAEALLASGRWAAAYYLLGYCVECALKACVAKQFRSDEVPDRKLVNSFYTHRLDELLSISEAKTQLKPARRAIQVLEKIGQRLAIGMKHLDTTRLLASPPRASCMRL